MAMPAKLSSKPVIIASVATVAASVLGGYIWHEEHRPSIAEAYVFALKSGRSTLIRTPDDHRILIDGGANSEVIRHLSSVLPFYSRRLDAVIATNTDGKNVSGLVDILERYQVDRVYIPAVTVSSLGISTSTHLAYQVFIDTIESKSIELKELVVGDTVFLGDVAIEVLFPVSEDSFVYSRASAPELVLKISYGNSSILMMNGVSIKIQKHIASHIQMKGGDVLVVSHSAAPAAVAYDLVSEVQPKFLVYSKTPSKSVGRTLSSVSKKIVDPLAGILEKDRFNLKEVGTVRISMDGEDAEITKTD
ncbi:MAG: hypothetical protein AAB365_02475 [Patescibacteria group bacterium]